MKMTHSLSYWITEFSPFWLGFLGLVIAICLPNVRQLSVRPTSIALFASPILVWVLQVGLTSAWGSKPIDGHVAPVWMQYAALFIFVSWPLLSIASIIFGRKTRTGRTVLMVSNIPAWLWSSLVSLTILNGITSL